MAREIPIRIIRATRSALDTEKGNSNLLAGELYQVTDETPNKLCLGISANDYIDINTSAGGSGISLGLSLASRNIQCFNNTYS